MEIDQKIVVRIIWHGEKEGVQHRIYLAPDGVGTCFTAIQDTLFFPINAYPEQAHLLKIRLPTQKSSVIYHTDGSITGITHWNAQKILLVVSRQRGDHLVTLSPEGHLLQQVAIGEREEGHKAVRVYAAPPLWMRMLDAQTLLIYSYGGNGTLFLFSLQGHLKQRWHGIKGVAFDPKKRQLYIDGEVRGSRFLAVSPPRMMKSPTWRLVGVDQHRRFYWCRSAMVGSWLACTGSGRIRWIVPLQGNGGGQNAQHRTPRFSLGWGGGTMEVFTDGRVWFSSSQVVSGEPPAVVPTVYEMKVLEK